MVPFEHYVKIKDNYCICYFGYCDEYLLLLELLLPKIEEKLSGLNLFIGCKDNNINLFNNREKVLPISVLKTRKSEFAHIKELQFNGINHPIEELVNEIDVNLKFNIDKKIDNYKKAVIITHGFYPTNPMTSNQIKTASSLVKDLNIEINGNWRDADVVIGVESIALIKAAIAGIRTIIVPNGIGTQFYKNMFNLEVLGD